MVVIQGILPTNLLNKRKSAVLKSRILILLLAFPAFLQIHNSIMLQPLWSRLPSMTKLATALPSRAADRVTPDLAPVLQNFYQYGLETTKSTCTVLSHPPSRCLHAWKPPWAWGPMSGRFLLSVCKKWYPLPPLSHMVTNASPSLSVPFQIFCALCYLCGKLAHRMKSPEV